MDGFDVGAVPEVVPPNSLGSLYACCLTMETAAAAPDAIDQTIAGGDNSISAVADAVPVNSPASRRVGRLARDRQSPEPSPGQFVTKRIPNQTPAAAFSPAGQCVGCGCRLVATIAETTP